MQRAIGRTATLVLLALGLTTWVLAEEPAPVTLANLVDPGPNKPDEPLAEHYSAAKSKQFLDAASLSWQKNRECMACHTNYLYLMARPALGVQDEAHQTVRRFAEDLVTKRWKEKGPRWDAEVVMTALVLAAGDAATGDKLHPVTREALDRMWTVQRDHGGFEWISCDWPPFESDHEIGAPLAALAVSLAPEGYAETPAAVAGIARIKQYLANTPMPTLHHRLMILWADTYRPGWLTPDQRAKALAEVLALQLPDGGWSAAAMGNWKRGDGTEQAVTTSDGYGTGLAIYLARRSGIAADDERLVRGVNWLKTHQRASGRWFTRSLFKDGRHYLTHAGTSMAILALDSCGALD